jgi:hypothetical protein
MNLPMSETRSAIRRFRKEKGVLRRSKRYQAQVREQDMQIGEPIRTFVVEPLELPVNQPRGEPEPIPASEPEPEQMPVAQ